MLTLINNSGSDILGRYYTKSEISSFLVSQLDLESPQRLLDLGAGSGSLSGAVKSRWPKIDILTVDIDPQSAAHHKAKDSVEPYRHQHYTIDALTRNLPDILNSISYPIDIAVCNPPFITSQWRDEFKEILDGAGFGNCLPSPLDVDAGLLFLAQNLRIVSHNATLAIILPDSLITAQRYLKFRKELLSNYLVSKVIQLPRGAFHGTDALASILIIRKNREHTSTLSLHKLSESGILSPSLEINIHEGIERLDHSYHFYKLNNHIHPALELGEIATTVERGSLSSSTSKKSAFRVLHITDIRTEDAGQWTDFEIVDPSNCAGNIKFAQPGDILLSRVGRNLHTKVIGVRSGRIPVSDCIYIIRCPPEARATVLRQLSSPSGRDWLAAHSYGVAAKQIAKKQLLKFPIHLANRDVIWNSKKEQTN
ncbi:N-6 DNA methylase [Pseudomonas sp. RAC1]|uniref:N-6 DNA methylase n=1 Tax=Pseudomonas sp. RAC1 TaxID=3064900 RepID=UPI002728509D|nr:N-6 DNA methylase [Pseudomonas sp. RAC1]MDV9031859.1 N-6 DNA methylase [Pseudomonas sp. RAC1]